MRDMIKPQKTTTLWICVTPVKFLFFMDNKSDCNKEFTSQNDISSCESSQGLLPLALKQLRLDPECVKNVYLIGSRLWQTQHPKSDYDLVVVLSSSKSSFFQNNNKIKNFGKKEGKHQTKKASNIPPKLNEFHQVLHAGNFDALIYDENLFIKRFGYICGLHSVH